MSCSTTPCRCLHAGRPGRVRHRFLRNRGLWESNPVRVRIRVRVRARVTVTVAVRVTVRPQTWA